jgi:hypothetical protein
VGDRAITYEDLIAPLRARGHAALCRVLEEKIAAYRGRKQPDFVREPEEARLLLDDSWNSLHYG